MGEILVFERPPGQNHGWSRRRRPLIVSSPVCSSCGYARSLALQVARSPWWYQLPQCGGHDRHLRCRPRALAAQL